MAGVGGGRFESVVQVERSRVVVDGVDEQGADADRAGRCDRARHRVAQQPGTDALPGDGAIDGEPREENDGNRVARHALGRPNGAGLSFDAASGHSVISDDALLLSVGDHVGPYRARGGASERVFDEPGVQLGPAAVEAVEGVCALERLGVAETRHYTGRGRRNSSLSAGFSRAGRSSAAAKRSHSASDSTN